MPAAEGKRPMRAARGGGCVYLCDRQRLVHGLTYCLNNNIPTTKGRRGGTMTGADREAAMPDQHTE